MIVLAVLAFVAIKLWTLFDSLMQVNTKGPTLRESEN